VSAKTIKRGLLWTLVVISVGFLFFTPYDQLLDHAMQVLPWVGTAIILSEALFMTGLIIMALAAGISVRYPWRLRRELKVIFRATANSRLFWTGFWINVVGALGSTGSVCVALFKVLPVQSWAIILIPLADLLATALLRLWVIGYRARERDPS
jgi:hypothetical protein